MKRNIGFIILLLLLAAVIGCKKDNNPASANVVATEQWEFVMDNDSSNHGQTTFEKKSDGSISGKANWYFVTQGDTTHSPFEGGTVTVTDTVISVIGHGTATNSNPAIPAGYQTSAFTVNINGSANNGKASGTWGITFSTYGWPASIQGTFTANRTSGSGITK